MLIKLHLSRTRSTKTVQSFSILSLAAFQGQNEEQILTGLALAGVLTGQLAGSSLRQRLVVATVRLAIEISVLGTRQQTLLVAFVTTLRTGIFIGHKHLIQFKSCCND